LFSKLPIWFPLKKYLKGQVVLCKHNFVLKKSSCLWTTLNYGSELVKEDDDFCVMVRKILRMGIWLSWNALGEGLWYDLVHACSIILNSPFCLCLAMIMWLGTRKHMILQVMLLRHRDEVRASYEDCFKEKYLFYYVLVLVMVKFWNL